MTCYDFPAFMGQLHCRDARDTRCRNVRPPLCNPSTLRLRVSAVGVFADALVGGRCCSCGLLGRVDGSEWEEFRWRMFPAHDRPDLGDHVGVLGRHVVLLRLVGVEVVQFNP